MYEKENGSTKRGTIALLVSQSRPFRHGETALNLLCENKEGLRKPTANLRNNAKHYSKKVLGGVATEKITSPCGWTT